MHKFEPAFLFYYDTEYDHLCFLLCSPSPDVSNPIEEASQRSVEA